jgi:hypothetical protein
MLVLGMGCGQTGKPPINATVGLELDLVFACVCLSTVRVAFQNVRPGCHCTRSWMPGNALCIFSGCGIPCEGINLRIENGASFCSSFKHFANSLSSVEAE